MIIMEEVRSFTSVWLALALIFPLAGHAVNWRPFTENPRPRNPMPLALPIRLLPLLLLPVLGACATRPEPREAWLRSFPEADSLRVTELQPGVRHSYLWMAQGPWAVNVVEIDRRRCAAEITAVKAGPPLQERAATSDLDAGAVAAVNADFFMSPGGTPVGAHVQEGRVVAGPGLRPVWLMAHSGRQAVGEATLRGWAAVPGDTAEVAQVNRPADSGRHHPVRPGLRLFDAWYGSRAPSDSVDWTLELRPLKVEGDAAAGAGVVVRRVAPRDSARLGPGSLAFQALGGSAADWLARRAVGDTVRWRVEVVPLSSGRGESQEPEVGPAVEAVGGFPLLIRDGRGVLAEQQGVSEGFGAARHPRTAVGWDAGGERLWWVVVDGRQAPYSDGMSLPELEWLLLRLGADHAINLDGGGSSTLFLDGRIANRPSDEEGERAVANALVLEGCDADR